MKLFDLLPNFHEASVFVFVFFLIFKDFIYLRESERERGSTLVGGC